MAESKDFATEDQGMSMTIGNEDYDEREEESLFDPEMKNGEGLFNLTEAPKQNRSAIGQEPQSLVKKYPPSFVTNPTPIIAQKKSPVPKKNVYDTGKVDLQIPEMQTFEDPAIDMEQDLNDSVSSDEFTKNYKSLPLIEKTETMKIYYNIVFCNLLATILIVKYEEMCKDQLQEASSEKFHLFVNQHLLQDPSTFSKLKQLLPQDPMEMFNKCKALIHAMAKCDGRFAFFPASKYSPNYSQEHNGRVLSLVGSMNMCNFSQIVAENLTNLYLEKIRLLSDSGEQEWEREYIFRSGFADDIWE